MSNSIEETIIKIGKAKLGNDAKIVVKYLGDNIGKFEITYESDGLTAGITAGVVELSSEDYENNIENVIRNLNEDMKLMKSRNE